MVVYGDPQIAIGAEALAHLRRRLVHCKTLGPAREFLVGCGQLEQALSDSAETKRAGVELAQSLTDLAAERWVSMVSGDGRAVPEESLQAILQELAGMVSGELMVRVPEGFAFYALYPEQYRLAALRWRESNEELAKGPIHVVGLRTIGTTLAAVVAAALRQQECRVTRATVRPGGHPFDRKLSSSPEFNRFRADGCALIVDEGPGLSGSSMASVGAALVAGGVRRERIFFMPAHGGGPGRFGSEEVRNWWKSTRSYAAGDHEPAVEGHTLRYELGALSGELLRKDDLSFHDLSGGQWRQEAGLAAGSWPAIIPKFEATKYLFRSGTGGGVLWKFAGLDLTAEFADSRAGVVKKRLHFLAQTGWTPKPLAAAHGFVALPWIEGERLTPDEVNYPMIGHLANYIRTAALPRLNSEVAQRQFEALKEMFYKNVHESMGEKAAELAKRMAGSIEAPIHLAGYGDGRMAPHEWLRTREGNLVKLDCAGHQDDHTCIGQQSVLWDAAGAIVEWRFPASAEVFLRQQLRVAEFNFTDDALAVCVLAYRAFKIGLLTFARESFPEGDVEQERVTSEIQLHTAEITKTLEARFIDRGIS